LNVLASVLLFQGLNWRLRGLGFPAQNLFKPLLLLNAAWIACIGFTRGTGKAVVRSTPTFIERLQAPACWTVLALVVFALYAPVFGINMADHDWTHRHIAAGLRSAADVWRLFITPQPDGMYRPLTFLSFLIDYRVFKDALWGYHAQSVGLHILNVLLVGFLALRLGLAPAAARTAAALFGVGAIHFEAILWPAARFDPLATAFSLLCLILFLQYWTAEKHSRGFACLSLICFVLGVLNKETAYSIVLLIPCIVLSRRAWQLDWAPVRKAAGYIVALMCCAAVLVAVRFQLFGGIGGYAYHSGRPAGADLSLKSMYLLAERSLALSPFGINCSMPTLGAAVLVVSYAVLAVAFVIRYAGSSDNRIRLFIGMTLASAAPAITVMGWVLPSLQHSRHLYWPSVWLSFAIALAIQRTSTPAILTGAVLIIQAAGLTYNLSVYWQALASIDRTVAEISGRRRDGSSPAPEVLVIGVPEHANGVLYYSPELQHRLRTAIPGVEFQFCGTRPCIAKTPGPAFTYVWNARAGVLERM